jgi:hypothetical protein
MLALLTAADAGVATAVVSGIFALLALVLRKAHVVGGEVTSVAVEARTAVHEARDEATEARHAAASVAAEMQPNGGSTLRDAIDRLAVTADRVDARTLVLDQRLTAAVAALDQRLTAIERQTRP